MLDLDDLADAIRDGIYGDDRATGEEVGAALNALHTLLDEVRRLQSGGCARDQRTTQFCAEVVAKDVEIRHLTSELATANDAFTELSDRMRIIMGNLEDTVNAVFDWQERNGAYTARKGIFLLTVSSEGYRLDALDFEDEPFPYPIACGPEVGEAGRKECEGAYYRAIGHSHS